MSKWRFKLYEILNAKRRFSEILAQYLCSYGGKLKGLSGVSLELSDREKFFDIFRTLGRRFGPNFGFPYMFYTFSLLPQLKIGRSQPA